MTTIGSGELFELRPRRWLDWRMLLKPRPLHASLIVSAAVALKAFEMSFAALHDLAVRNLVAPHLASNVPIAIDGLVVGSIIATASFKKGSVGWWYATGLFVLSTLVSVGGNIEYAREIGGGPVSLGIYAGMPMTLLFAVHLTLMLWSRGRDNKRAPQAVDEPEPVAETAEQLMPRIDALEVAARAGLTTLTPRPTVRLDQSESVEHRTLVSTAGNS
ncbi:MULTISPECIES: DUF2637 domain-containing protein [unclassified Nocardia]|uniref:DUF2637 domain-containing protein n=1 Tax=unclassified Nocardia TaxID=2637762 RepID=UPI001CE4813A|nr:MULTISPECIES: DUF2637 domain-containing protein [unclassified Nocardia]